MANTFWPLVLGMWVAPGTSQPIQNSSSGISNKSAATSFAPVSAPQGPQEAHGLHLFVPGASVVVQILNCPMTIYILQRI